MVLRQHVEVARGRTFIYKRIRHAPQGPDQKKGTELRHLYGLAGFDLRSSNGPISIVFDRFSWRAEILFRPKQATTSALAQALAVSGYDQVEVINLMRS